MSPVDPSKPLLSVRRLQVHYPLRGLLPWRRGSAVRAVNDVHFDLHAGETLGIVGESGCGKSTLARTLIGLQQATNGSIRYQGTELVGLDQKDWRALRSEIQLVFQDPLGSLSPRMKIGDIVAEPLKALQPGLSADERRSRAIAMLERVGLGSEHLQRQPQELSGGQRQRIAIARALACKPEFIVCDEPVSALDVSIQAQLVNLLADLQREQNLAMIFIAHDLAVVRQLAGRVLVMYLGKVMEQGRADDVYENPKHPYTRALLEAVPSASPDPARSRLRKLLRGDQPSPAHPPMGCVFHPRCPLAEHACVQSVPLLRRVSGEQYAACHFMADHG
ncbi:MAG: ATP-binding cassette domain-containing protein [Nevskia sp.]